ncbi:MAG: hypothetical protein P8H56_09995 [Crocinitomicaceae bacterium]|nr:hypothetical protein [Crocinitomicaceae bacterium]
MKRGILLALTAAFVSVLLTSCGGGAPTKEDLMAFSPKLSTTTIALDGMEISGDLGDYLTIKNKEVTVNFIELTNAEWVKNEHKQVWEFKLNVERTSKELEWGIDSLNGNYTELVMSIFDDKGQPIAGLDPIGCYGHGLVDDILTLNAGENGWATFTIELGDYPEEDIIKSWSKFKVTSKVGFTKESSDSATTAVSDDESEDNGETLSENEYDEMLNDYEDYVDEYIVFYKKAAKGDLDAMSDYQKLQGKAEKFDAKMAKARNNNNLTAKQVSRFLEIQTKMGNAIVEALK